MMTPGRERRVFVHETFIKRYEEHASRVDNGRSANCVQSLGLPSCSHAKSSSKESMTNDYFNELGTGQLGDLIALAITTVTPSLRRAFDDKEQQYPPQTFSTIDNLIPKQHHTTSTRTLTLLNS